MLAEERKERIVKKINKNGSATVRELSEELKVSESTVRRALTDLNREGRIIKIHGGAIALGPSDSPSELSVKAKEQINKDEKLKIAEYAASLIVPGDIVYIDSGTTTECMIGFIKEKKATYVTNAVSHAKDLVRKGFKVLLIGGELKENTEAIVGSDAILHIQKYHFTKGFFGTNGINLKLGFTTPDVREALVKRIAIENTQAGQKYILADHDKFGKSSAVTFSDFVGTVVITDKRPDSAYMKIMDVKIVK